MKKSLAQRRVPSPQLDSQPSQLHKQLQAKIPRLDTNCQSALGDIHTSRPQIYNIISQQQKNTIENNPYIHNSASTKSLLPPTANKITARIIQRTRNNYSTNSHQSNHQDKNSTFTISESETKEEDSDVIKSHQVSHFEKIEHIKFEFYEVRQEMLQDLKKFKNKSQITDYFLKKLDKFEIINNKWESLCENLTAALSKQQDNQKSMKRTIQSLKNEKKKETMKSERELERTKKMFERSLSDIRNTYQRGQELIEQDIKDFELIAQEQKQQRTKLKIKHLGFLNTIEQELQSIDDDEIFKQSKQLNFKTLQQNKQSFDFPNKQLKSQQSIDSDQHTLELTSKFSSQQQVSYRGGDQKQFQSIEQDQSLQLISARIPVLNIQNNSYLEKTTPRSSRPNYQQNPQIINISKQVIQQNDLQSQIDEKDELQHSEIYSSLDCRNKMPDSNMKTRQIAQLEDSKINDSVMPPPMMLNDNFGEWDSMLDTKLNIDQDELSWIQKEYQEKIADIQDPNERVIFAMKHNINSALLLSQPKIQQINNINTPKLHNNRFFHDQSAVRSNRKTNNNILQNSYLKSSCSKNSRNNCETQKKNYIINSSNKKYKCSDARLSDILAVQNEFQLESPLSPLKSNPSQFDQNSASHNDGIARSHKQHKYRILDQDVRVEDIINAPDMSISMKTATDAGNFLNDEKSQGANGSFFKSDIKRSNFKQMKTINDSYIIYQYNEEDSMIQIRDMIKLNDESDNKNIRSNKVFNIIDDNHNNGECSGNNLEESSSSYSKTGNINFKHTLGGSHTSKTLLDEFNNEIDNITPQNRKDQIQILPASFKNTAVINNKEIEDQMMLSNAHSQIPTPAFNYRQPSEVSKASSNGNQESGHSSNGGGLFDNSIEANKIKGNHLMQNHNKLIRKIIQQQQNQEEQCHRNINDQSDNKENQNDFDQYMSVNITNNINQSSGKDITILEESKANQSHIVLRSSSVNSNGSNKIKLSLIKKGSAPNNQGNQSMITVLDKKNLKIPIKNIKGIQNLKQQNLQVHSVVSSRRINPIM